MVILQKYHCKTLKSQSIKLSDFFFSRRMFSHENKMNKLFKRTKNIDQCVFSSVKYYVKVSKNILKDI